MKRLLLMALLAPGCSEATAPRPAPVTGLTVVTVAGDLTAPVHLTAPPGDARLFIVEQPGRIRIVRNGVLLPTLFLDITARVGYGGERGLLSMAFDPQYATTGFFWVNYTDLTGTTQVERYRVSTDPDVADPASASTVLQVAQPFGNHNGGLIAFGPDGMLYVGMGDGGSGGDPQGHGQNPGTLLGALLRIDVRGAQPYTIPQDNPYAASASARPEIWAHGLRNPWRFSFDEPAGLIYIADVGQNMWEEINAAAASSAGLNYGWNVMEGSHCFAGSPCDQQGLTSPVHEYPHADGCSVTGGHVYRGARLTIVQGHYLYSDYCRGWLRSFRLVDGSAVDHREWSIGSIGRVLSFGVDAAGELYMLTDDGHVLRIDPVT